MITFVNLMCKGNIKNCTKLFGGVEFTRGKIMLDREFVQISKRNIIIIFDIVFFSFLQETTFLFHEMLLTLHQTLFYKHYQIKLNKYQL